MFAGYAPRAGRRGGLAPGRGREPVPAAERGRDLGRRGTRSPLRAAEVAVHAVGDPCEHRGDPRRARRAPGATRSCSSTGSTTATSTRRWSSSRTATRPRGGRPAARRDVEDRDRAVQRRRRLARGARDRRDRHRHHRTRADEQRRPPAARWTGSTTALRAITRETGTLLAYDETHTQVVGAGGLTAPVGSVPRRRDDRASRSRAASRWAPTA